MMEFAMFWMCDWADFHDHQYFVLYEIISITRDTDSESITSSYWHDDVRRFS